MTVPQADSTLVAIRKKVRRLTASSSESALTTNDLDQYINTFYNNDFPYGVKMDQMRSVYTFFTTPYQDRYPLDVNYNQGIRDPVYIEGIQGYLFKDRDSFFKMWPRWPTKFNPITGNGIKVAYTFTIPAPFLAKEVVLGGTDINGTAISINDDGAGNLFMNTPNAVTTVPPYTTNYTAANAPVPALIGKPIPGMHNQNTLNPGLNNINTPTGPYTPYVGTVNYQTGVFNIEFPVAPSKGNQMTLWVSQYQPGRPYSILFWNNEFTIRPIPTLIHKVEVETYLTPVQFMASTDQPILSQWWQYIAIGAAIKVLEDRQDMEGLANLVPLFDRQEALCLERQSIEEIGQRNSTIFSSNVMQQGWNNGSQGWY